MRIKDFVVIPNLFRNLYKKKMLKQSERNNVFKFSMTFFHQTRHSEFISESVFLIDAESKRTQQCVQVQHDGVRFVLRPKIKYSTTNKKIFCAQNQNLLRPIRKSSTPNRKLFYAQNQNHLRPREKYSTSKKKLFYVQEQNLFRIK